VWLCEMVSDDVRWCEMVFGGVSRWCLVVLHGDVVFDATWFVVVRVGVCWFVVV